MTLDILFVMLLTRLKLFFLLKLLFLLNITFFYISKLVYISFIYNSENLLQPGLKMNSLKLILTSITLLSLNAAASNTQAPSTQYTEIKNSVYVSHLEKRRNSISHERDIREEKRNYMIFKRGLDSK